MMIKKVYLDCQTRNDHSRTLIPLNNMIVINFDAVSSMTCPMLKIITNNTEYYVYLYAQEDEEFNLAHVAQVYESIVSGLRNSAKMIDWLIVDKVMCFPRSKNEDGLNMI